jgi:hypothetical protein
VAGRVSPTDRARAEIDQLFASDRDLAWILEEVARLGVRLLMQTALEAEAEEFLGRARYQRRTEEHRAGVRNGWQPPTAVKTTIGRVELQRPKLRATDQAFCSRLFGAGVARTNALESLVISGWVRGLSDRDIEAALAEVLGAEAALSRSTVSRICQRINDEFERWRTRDLSGLRLDDLFLDASHCKMHPGAPAEPVLAAWASIPTASQCWSGWRRPAQSRPTPGRRPRRSDPAWAAGAVASDQRRRSWAHRRLRPGVSTQPAPAVPCAPRPHYLGQGVGARPGRGEGRRLGHLGCRRGRTRRCGGRRRPGPGGRVRRHLAGPLPRSGRLCHPRPGLAHRPPAVPG